LGSITPKCDFHSGSVICNSDAGASLNRFSGTANEDEYGDIDADAILDSEFDQSASPSPILKDLSKGRLVLRGGVRGNLSQRIAGENQFTTDVSLSDRVRRGYRSKRSEDRYKLSHMVFDGPVRVRIMDVDAFNLAELHNYFMYTMVRRFPAEECVKLAARIALFRDKNTQRSFECLSRDVVDVFGPVHGPELSALFSRCYNTIPVAFMLDYTRRFGRFSRKFIAHQVDKTMNPRLFDFVRYSGGVKPLPGIVTRPFALRSFAQLLPPCSAKKYIFQHLLCRTGDAKTLESLRIQASELERDLHQTLTPSHMDPLLGPGARIAEGTSRKLAIRRPKDIEEFHSDAHTNQPVCPDDFIKTLESSSSSAKADDPKPVGGLYEMQFTQIQPFKSPLMEDTDALIHPPTNQDSIESVGHYQEDQAGETWYQCNRTKFFRHNKKAYKMVDGEGWKQIADPRGELPDYGRSKAFREKQKSITQHYSRIKRMRKRAVVARDIVKRELGKVE